MGRPGDGCLTSNFALLTFLIFGGLIYNSLCAGNDLPSFELRELNSRIDKGREEITKLQQRAILPRGSCWKSALEELEVKCKAMGPEVQSRLALKFTTCYNEILGFPPVVCEARTPLKECMRHMDDSNRNTFREFFLHTQDMCYFIEHQLWQERTSDAVNEVTNVVGEVTKNIEETRETQESILHSQMESLRIQGDIARENNALHEMVVSAKEVFEEVQLSAVEQRQVFVEIFDKLTRMQKLVSWIQGEMSLLDMMGFYFTAMIFGFFCTASERTRKTRFWIVMLVMCAVAMDRLLYNYMMQNMFTPEAIQEWLWNLRRIVAVLGGAIIVNGAARYKDPQTTQQDMIASVKKHIDCAVNHMDSIMQRMEGNGNRNMSNAALEDEDVSDADTFSNYSEDSESEGEGDQKGVENSKFNDENKIPMADPAGVLNHMHNYNGKPFGSQFRGSSVTNQPHAYNLRTKRADESGDNSILQTESSTQFAKSIKRRTTPQPRSDNFYSSDEDL